jgi:hypothetical protein
MRERRFLTLFLLVFRVNAEVTELCTVYTENTKVDWANDHCENIGGTLWLPQSSQAIAYR